MAAGLALAALACGHPEKSVVDQYFNASNQKDTQTLSSFAAVTANKKAASAYALDHYGEIDQVKEVRKNGKPVPAKLSDVASKWDDFNNKDRDLKKAVAINKDAIDKEKRSLVRSIGEVDDAESLKGDVTDKQIEVDLTIGGQVIPYVMTLRKYDLKRDNGQRVMSRWVIQNLQPKA